MTTKYAYQPDYASPPGATLRDTLEEKGLSQSDLALRAGLTEKTISQIINGVAPISYDTAAKLELVLGVPARFWNAREQNYRETLVRLDEMKRFETDVEWLKEIPVAELISRNCIQDNGDQRSLVRQALQFFGVSSVEAWRNTWLTPAAQYRGGAAAEKHPGHASAWLRLGEITAANVLSEPFDANRFRQTLREVRPLNLLPMKEACPKLIQACAGCGVVVALIKEMPGAGVSGAARWINKERALVQLSFRYKLHDQFWFSFFHEAAHILLHGKKFVFVEYDRSGDTEEEREANDFAANILIPEPHNHQLQYLRTSAQIVAFAKAIGIRPGIVVGRLQHDDSRLRSRFNSLKQKVEWSD